MRYWLAFILVGVVFISGCLGGGGQKVITRYQCYDGSVASYLNECPKQSGATISSTTIVQTTVSSSSGECPVCTKSCPTTIPCGQPTRASTTSLPPKLGPLCTEDSDCGTYSYGGMRCSNGDAYRIKNTPKCSLDNWDNQKHCKTLSEQELSQECGSNQRCVKDKGCIAYSDDN